MNEQHPITPPQELVSKWTNEAHLSQSNMGSICKDVAVQSARWGADQELEACCEWLRGNGLYETRIGHLREARRPKPPTLKKLALEVLDRVSKDQSPCNYQADEDWETIRKALETLPDEEV